MAGFYFKPFNYLIMVLKYRTEVIRWGISFSTQLGTYDPTLFHEKTYDIG
jgi:hypothetical protein